MRTSVSEVKNILDNTQLSDAVITAYINSANVFVTESLGTSSLGADTLENIEMWLSAHMIVTTRERQSIQEQAGTAMIKWAGQWGQGLLSTTYGQMAVALDTTGTLANLARVKSNAWIKAVPNFD